MSSKTRILCRILGLALVALWVAAPLAAQTLEGKIVESGTGTVMYTIDINTGPPSPNLFFAPWQMQLNTLSFTPGSVTFQGQPIDFSGTEAQFLASQFQGDMVLGGLPLPNPGPMLVGSLGGCGLHGAAGDQFGIQRSAQMLFGPGLQPGFFPLQPDPFVHILRFDQWQLPFLPQLDGRFVSWVFQVNPTFIDPNNGVIQATVDFDIYADIIPPVFNFEVHQTNWFDENGILIVPDSSWATLQFEVEPHIKLPFYLNIWGDAGFGPALILENFPIFPLYDPLSPLLPPQQIDIPLPALGVPPGPVGGGLDLMLQALVLPGGPPPPFSPQVTIPFQQHDREASGSKYPGAPPQTTDIGNPSGFVGNGPPKNAIRQRAMPAVQEESNACLAGAFARSISWLDDEYGLLSLKTPQQIYQDLRNLGVGSSGSGATTYEQDVKSKSDYLKTLHPLAVTKILDLNGAIGPVEGVKQETAADLPTWLEREMKTEDVELHYGNHIVTLTTFWRSGDPPNEKIFVKYRDDEKQGDNSKGDTAEKTAELRKDASGNYYFRQEGTKSFFRVQAAISESVPIEISMSKFGSGLIEIDIVSAKDPFRSFDMVSGSLADLPLAQPMPCLLNSLTSVQYPYQLSLPHPAEFFLVRGETRVGATTSNSLGLAQVGDRDPLFECPQCEHDPLWPGPPLDPFCDAPLPGQPSAVSCADSVCSIYPSCCDLQWDPFCVEQAVFVCGLCD